MEKNKKMTGKALLQTAAVVTLAAAIVTESAAVAAVAAAAACLNLGMHVKEKDAKKAL